MNELLTSLLENPEVLKEMIKEQVGQYKPLVYMIGTELLEYKNKLKNYKSVKEILYVKINR